ncbi:sialidase family protein [Mucilaginibacter phyllosphaerae]|uniref:Alpha-L-fucosidase n=1 Tax=Mucilaginibacter phyllosphaerae TaxID=1812349 RepID=A0A4Y8ADB0_9SPHI|nr:sialidase family protein [Mucilaginibacter phyllosphaerae]MBB3969203.1 alpha-L-fucosidase [Mucilaginibacter phyllosphaerae]TEW65992.1 sialidase [Mucilaginibacter phyllosphaerae]GGH06968.1 hypothetical protein GCM10007352_11440 [Mucilaginibacter phyllosphaerae]
MLNIKNLVLSIAVLFVAVAAGLSQNIRVINRGYIFDKSDFKASHASTIVQLNHKKFMAAWFGGDHEGSSDVCIWASILKNNSWGKPVKIAKGTTTDNKTYACWNPVLFKAHNGKLYLHYKVGINPREWKAMYKVSADEGKTWSALTALPDGFLGPIKNKPVQLKNGTILYPCSVESIDEKSWTIHLETTDANIKNWKRININCDTFQVIQPTILLYPHNRLQLLARSKQNVIVQSWSADGGKSWSKVTATSIPNPNSGIDAVTTAGGLQLLVYNPLTSGKNWWEGRSVLKLACSRDGITWKDLLTFEDQKTGEFSYPAIIYDKAGFVYATWTDNRKKIAYIKLAVQ